MRKRPWRVEETPYPKRRTRLPVILSREEVARLIESASNPFHRTILMTLYATGVRRAELARLKLTDIDTERMVLHIRNGKGRKDRDVVLSPHLLTELRQHYRRLAPKPATWLFPGGQRHTADYPVSAKGLLERLPRSVQTRWHSQSASPSHPSALLRYPSAGVRRRPADYPDSPRPQRSEADRHLYPCVATASERYREPAGCPADVRLAHRPLVRCRGRLSRWPTSSALPERAFSKTAENGSPGSISRWSTRFCAAGPPRSADMRMRVQSVDMRPSHSTRAETAIAQNARLTHAAAGSKRGAKICCPPATSI